MLTKLTLRNFKQFNKAEIELGSAVVFIGPNNSGKTTALQALALWDIGLRLWNARRGGKASPEKRPGVTINRRDLISIPVPIANLLWRNLRVRNVQQANGKTKTQNIRIDITVEGVTENIPWSCGLEFDYSNEESFVCRPLRLPEYAEHQVRNAKFSALPDQAGAVKVAYLPPMSGLADREFIKQEGEIGFLIGQGQTAQVLRNLCYQIYSHSDKTAWGELTGKIRSLFGVALLPPRLLSERAEITMHYEEDGTELDLSSSGRGLQQTLLLLTHLYAHPRTVLLLDEPDAHLEILRQRQTFQLLTEVADAQGSQIIAASHSEVVLSEAAGRGKVIAFVGNPHTLNDHDKGSQVIKSLTTIGWDQYFQAEETGWVLYLEGSTDLAILQAFAERLNHPSKDFLGRPFCHYVSTNLPQTARDHFFGLREGKPDLQGIAVFDRLSKELATGSPLVEVMWRRREIENYFCAEDVLLAYAGQDSEADLFSQAAVPKRQAAMREAIAEVSAALRTLGKPDPWSADIKATDEFLDPVFKTFFSKLGLALTFRKSDYHVLARLVPAERIDPEVVEKLDKIVEVARRAIPRKQ
ncbi:MAG TPA: AAA family ATPase [Tepidisphaeraceae bacterium]|jgi:predicted ATPase|nr:AAA family ATPase [Tepidisphaeraceae bacterium]